MAVFLGAEMLHCLTCLTDNFRIRNVLWMNKLRSKSMVVISLGPSVYVVYNDVVLIPAAHVLQNSAAATMITFNIFAIAEVVGEVENLGSNRWVVVDLAASCILQLASILGCSDRSVLRISVHDEVQIDLKTRQR